MKANTVSKPSVYTEDYKHCSICTRSFNENAYAKHLPTCERRNKEAQMKNKVKPGTTGGMGSINTNGNSKPNLNVKFNKK